MSDSKRLEFGQLVQVTGNRPYRGKFGVVLESYSDISSRVIVYVPGVGKTYLFRFEVLKS